jgi:SAM-dependent methyltransferase
MSEDFNKKQEYASMQKHFYYGGTTNHLIHNNNKNYWNILLSDLKEAEKWRGEKALDFGSGKGRNVTNMLSLCNWERVDGVDISVQNIKHCQANYEGQASRWYLNDGLGLSCIPGAEEYSFVMSTIALQHIAVYEIRKSIIQDIYRLLKPQGVFSFQMGYGENMNLDPLGRPKASYYENAYHAHSTNSEYDVRVTSEQDIIEDMKNIGFTEVETTITDTLSDNGEVLDIGHPNWIWVRCVK